MADGIAAYHQAQSPANKRICDALRCGIDRGLTGAESKIWHGGPVWFIAGNPVAGYWVRKSAVQLLFWSGQSFDEPGLKPEGKFKAAAAHFTDADEIDPGVLQRRLAKAARIQWDYKNIVKRRGALEKIGEW